MGIKSIREIGKKIYKKNPSIQPFIDSMRNKEPDVVKFSGWGMTSIHEFPWNDPYQGENFRKANENIKNDFDFSEDTTLTSMRNLDALRWRHWNISYGVRYCLEFSETTEYNFVECGVAEGVTSFFVLSEIDNDQLIKKSALYLYDAWADMKDEHLLDSEKHSKGKYEKLSMERTKNNLSKFKTKRFFHKGYVPEVLINSNTPKTICYLHIDLNSSKPTLGALEIFYPKLVKGGVIIFDDYAHSGYEETKIVVDEFFKDKSGLLQKLPTGQAIYYKH